MFHFLCVPPYTCVQGNIAMLRRAETTLPTMSLAANLSLPALSVSVLLLARQQVSMPTFL